MGGRGRSRTQRKHFNQSREDVWKFSSKSGAPTADLHNSANSDGTNTVAWQPLATQNASFEDYYKEQGIVAPEEWDIFMEVLRKPLPAAFRINASSQFCLDIRTQLEDDFVKSLQSELIGEDEVEALRPLPWYPENLAWHSNFSRKQLRKTQTLERFHEFLKLAHEIGNITRQEAVSMVPPLFLDVHSDHSVLDMCAAPGSKTFQLLEIIHSSNELGSLSSGMVVANDVDVQRSNLLIHQTKRMCTANLIVTNHEAQNFPGCSLSKVHHDSSDIESMNGSSLNQLLFDRVLCDVPCSGDGTLRKAPDMWRRWNSGMGNGLHGLQVKIAMRGISLLKVGGRMVYSTCSMNPIEDEAVVAEILHRCGDSVELIDVSDELPQLVRRPGLKKWKVRDKGLFLSSYEEVPKHRRPGILRSMFSSGRHCNNLSVSGGVHDNGGNLDAESVEKPTTNDDVSPSEVTNDGSNHPLERCMRFLPHDWNSGAFFIAVFHKRSSLPVQEQSSVTGRFSTVKGRKISESKDKSDDSASNVDEAVNANSREMSTGALPVDTVNEETSLDNVPVQTLENKLPDDQQAICDEDAGLEKAGTKRKLQIQGKWKGLDPVILFDDKTVINSIKTFYGIDDSFHLDGHLVSRNSDADSVKRIYYISKAVKNVLELNLLTGQQLKIASVGLKMFERQTSKDGNSSNCRYRISSEGLPLLLPNITKQILLASLDDFKRLLEKTSIKFGDFVDAELNERASKLELGCCVLVLRKGGQELTVPLQVDSSTIAVGCWRGRSNVNVMVSALDCKDLLERLEIRTKAGSGEGAEPLNNVDGANIADVKEEGMNMEKNKECGDLVGV